VLRHQPSSCFSYNDLVIAGRDTIVKVRRLVRSSLERNADHALEPITIGARSKPALRIDLTAEETGITELSRRLCDYQPRILGEESMKDQDLDLTNEDRLVVLIDMVDGSDLLARGFGNWGSAIVFFYPSRREILAALVGLADGDIYFATDATGAMKYCHKSGPNPVPVRGPSTVEAIEDSAICFYGQKVSNFCAAAHDNRFAALLEKLQSTCPKELLRTRIWNLGGNPIMCRLIDGAGIDAVLEMSGQAPHDCVAGAYIAQKAGAVFSSVEGSATNLNGILLRPADPRSRIKYVLASTEELAFQLRAELSGPELQSRPLAVA
jgi:fructose-1,6-bisphosphatase/inositol monophosphatase family enzyme